MTMAASFDFVYGGEVVDLTQPAAAWYFEPGATPTADAVLQVAHAFGIDGEVREVAADMGGGWIVGSDDYSQPSVTVGTDATLGWWYNPGAGGPTVSSGCAVPEPGTPIDDTGSGNTGSGNTGSGTAEQPLSEPMPPDEAALTTILVDPICAEPKPPANVPSAAEAESKATELLTALGLQPADYEFETYADEWGASVTAYLRLDGIRTSMAINVGYGAEGAVTWAGGFLATPQQGGDYPRIGIDASIERLNDQNTGWMYGSTSTARAEATPGEASIDVATGAATEIAPNAATDADADADKPISPTETVTPPEFETVTVTLTNARPSLEMLWAADNTVWLLPGYAFDSTDGGLFSVIAVEDQYIDVAVAPLGEPETTPPASAVPAPTETGVIAPTPSDPADPADPTKPTEPQCPETTSPTGGSPTSGSPTGESPAPDSPTAAAAPAEIDDGSQWIGLCIADATKLAERSGYQLRAVRIDGVEQAVTMDFSESRFNVSVDNGIVTGIVSIG